MGHGRASLPYRGAEPWVLLKLVRAAFGGSSWYWPKNGGSLGVLGPPRGLPWLGKT